MMVCSSSSVTVGSSCPSRERNSFLRPRVIAVNTLTTGDSARISTSSDDATNRANRSLQALLMDLGIISAKRNTVSVVTIEVSPTTPAPQSRVATSVASEAQPMCMMLVPIKMVESA